MLCIQNIRFIITNVGLFCQCAASLLQLTRPFKNPYAGSTFPIRSWQRKAHEDLASVDRLPGRRPHGGDCSLYAESNPEGIRPADQRSLAARPTPPGKPARGNGARVGGPEPPYAETDRRQVRQPGAVDRNRRSE